MSNITSVHVFRNINYFRALSFLGNGSYKYNFSFKIMVLVVIRIGQLLDSYYIGMIIIHIHVMLWSTRLNPQKKNLLQWYVFLICIVYGLLIFLPQKGEMLEVVVKCVNYFIHVNFVYRHMQLLRHTLLQVYKSALLY